MPAQKFARTVAKQFGLELRSARIEAGLTQQVLAERADVDPVFVSYLENGHRQPSLAVLISLERVLGVEPGSLAFKVARSIASGEPAKVKRRARRNE